MSRDPHTKNYRRYPKATLLLFNAGILIVLFLLAEAGLRLSGQQPGVIFESGDFFGTDSFYVKNEYAVGEDGIMRVSDTAKSIMYQHFERSPDQLDNERMKSQELESTIADLLEDHYLIKSGQGAECEFCDFVSGLKKKGIASVSPAENAYLDYANFPVNADGFRSIAFRNYQTEQKKILLLGDSFTWGLGAKPLYNSFADILGSRSYLVFNTGICGVDPSQYAAVAEKYIPLIKPDVVIVNFCMANDVMGFPREAEPYRFVYHNTSAGWLNAYFTNCYLGPKESYELYMNLSVIPFQQSRFFNRLCATSSLFTRFWLLLSRFGWVESYQQPECDNPWKSGDYSEFFMEKIRQSCEQGNAKMILALIPDNNELGASTLEAANRTFDKTEWHLPPVSEADYHKGNVHFNNRGNRVYADFLQALIEKPENSQTAE